ncbi:MAG: short-chain dehydrogenase [Rhodospirillaceae bacterium]|nr:short-chain dehydrogenase [Rhodospirillaceae bacterium]|tara:strand:+ start:136 stop:903 length:768 start_codon:yes stop_codon:yes gene_type:complete
MIFNLSGKVAVVTGSTKGIGKSIAENMAALGAQVVISSRKLDACENVAKELQGRGYETTPIPCHIGRKEELENLVSETIKVYQKIDILVCNAATNPVYGPMLNAGDEAYDKIMDTNVKSVFQLCNIVCPSMAERRDGVVIIISSIGGFKGSKNLGLYSLSKAAEQQLVRNLAVEWGPHNIRVNAIAPGLIKTDFARELWEDPKKTKAVERITPLGRLGDPDDIGGLTAALATKAGNYLTGQTITIDGGRMITDPS